MGVGSRDHRIKLQCNEGNRRFINREYSSDGINREYSSEDDAEKQIRERKEFSQTMITMNYHLKDALIHHQSARKPMTICRAPMKLKMLHVHGFNPTLVAIGPLHCYQIYLRPMEAHKWRFLARLLENLKFPGPVVHPNGTLSEAVQEELVSPMLSGQASSSSSSSSSTNANGKKMEYLVAAMKGLEAYTRDCYLYKFPQDSSKFVVMMIIDSCFVVELLRLYGKWGTERVDEPLFNTRWMVPSLKHDLIMLENQLPFPVLEKIFDITSSGEERFTLKDLTLRFFNSLLPREKPFLGECTVESSPNHLLGLFRSSFQVQPPCDTSNGSDQSRLRSWIRVPSHGIHSAIKSIKRCLGIRQTDNPDPLPAWVHERKLLIHCVTELVEAGISFKKRENHDLLDIEFKNGKLYIPPLFIDDYTPLLFMNFVAYEQCNPSTEPYFTTYLLFWDSLLNSSKDVEHLHLKGIIDHVLGSDEDVAQLFNKLCREVVHDLGDCYLSKVLEDVNQYFGVRRHRWRAKWTHDYFSSPWAFVSLIAAVFLLILTFIQAFFSVFTYVLPAS